MKKNMLLISFIFIFILIFTGCDDSPKYAPDNSNNRFVSTGQTFYLDGSYKLTVFEDKETEILYFYNINGGMSVWLDKDGSPMTREKMKGTKK